MNLVLWIPVLRTEIARSSRLLVYCSMCARCRVVQAASRVPGVPPFYSIHKKYPSFPQQPAPSGACLLCACVRHNTNTQIEEREDNDLDFLKATAGERARLFAERYEAAVHGLEWPVSGGGEGGGEGGLDGGGDPDDRRRRSRSGEIEGVLAQEAAAAAAAAVVA